MPEKSQKNQQQHARPIEDQQEQKRQFESPEHLLEEDQRREHESTAADAPPA